MLEGMFWYFHLFRGSFGQVFEATYDSSHGQFPDTKERVAIKVIEKSRLDWDSQFSQNLQREVDIMKNLRHPNVLSLKNLLESESHLGLIMEFVGGGELFEHITQLGRFSEFVSASIVRQICAGAAYLHQNGIAHRDLKPENLLVGEEVVDGEKRVVICDFGLGKFFGHGDLLKSAVGTTNYMAPEILRAAVEETTYGPEVDIWSIGVVAYVLLCGYFPFTGDESFNEDSMFHRIINANFSFPDPEWTHISQEAKDFIRGLLQADPRRRVTAMMCLDHPWLNQSQDDGMSLRQSQDRLAKSLGPETGRQRRRIE